MKTRTFVLVIAALLAVGGLAFAKGASESAGSQPVQINVFQSKTTIADQFDAFARAFESANPGIKVTVDTVGGSADWQTILKSRFAADQGPDIFNIEGPAQYELWKDNIADLTGSAFLKDAVPSALKPLNINGKQWGMPVNFEGYGYIYNKDIFAKAGITTTPTTLTQLRDVAAKLQAAGYQPFATGYGTWWVIGLHLLNVAFAQQPDPQAFMKGLTDGTQTFSGNKIFQDLKNVIDLTVKYGGDNPLASDHNQQVQLLASGDVAMIQQGVWKEPTLYKANPNINVGLLPIPLNDDPSMNRIPVGVPWFFVINSKSSPEKQAASKTFLNYLFTTDTGKNYLTEKFGYIPALKGVSGNGLGGVGKGILAYSAEDKTIPWVFGQWPDGFAQQDAFKNMQAYIAGNQSWQQTLQALDKAWRARSK